ncbi:hypothetical protein GCM10010530_10020 [Kribbella aluminosa]
MQDQPTDETPQQIVERELRAAQEQVRRVAAELRAGLAEDDRRAAEARTATKDER